ncbi:MAG TPA: SIMPL domain-containing protein [Xanthobacteraceae bacterium]|nr:SIMPL domain-containing protein [Xanthobacteraceae bacterium]
MSRLFLAAAAILFVSIAPVSAETADRTLTVVGTGEVHAVPDSALVTAGVSSDADSAAAALQANNDAMAKVLDAIRSSGIEARDIQTSGLSLEPRHARPSASGNQDRLRIIGYTAANEVTVRGRDLSKVGSLLDKITAAGANRIAGIRFLVSRQETLLDDARKQAVADARRKAELYAQAGGFRLGKILSLTEESTSMPRPMARATAMMSTAAPVPIESGEVALSARLRVVWAVVD